MLPGGGKPKVDEMWETDEGHTKMRLQPHYVYTCVLLNAQHVSQDERQNLRSPTRRLMTDSRHTVALDTIGVCMSAR